MRAVVVPFIRLPAIELHAADTPHNRATAYFMREKPLAVGIRL